MSSRPMIGPFPVFNSTTGQSMASATLTSLVTVIKGISMLSYGISWAGSTPIGIIQAQVSNDYSENADGSVKNSGTWNVIPFDLNGSIVTSIPITGNTGNGFIDIDQTGAYAVRLLYTKTSGTGTLSAIVNGKVA